MDRKLRKALIANRIRMCAACGEPIMADDGYSRDGVKALHLDCALDPRDSTVTTPINTNE